MERGGKKDQLDHTRELEDWEVLMPHRADRDIRVLLPTASHPAPVDQNQYTTTSHPAPVDQTQYTTTSHPSPVDQNQYTTTSHPAPVEQNQ